MENQTIIRKNRVFGHKFLPKFFATIARSEMLTTESELRSARGPQRYDPFVASKTTAAMVRSTMFTLGSISQGKIQLEDDFDENPLFPRK